MDYTYLQMDPLEEWLSGGSPQSDEFLYGYHPHEEVDEGFCDSDENSHADPSGEDLHPLAHNVPTGQGEEYDAGYGDIDKMFEFSGLPEAVKTLCDETFPEPLPFLPSSFPILVAEDVRCTLSAANVDSVNLGPGPSLYPAEEARGSVPPSLHGVAEVSETGAMFPPWGPFTLQPPRTLSPLPTQHQPTLVFPSSPAPSPHPVPLSDTRNQCDNEETVSPIPGYSTEELVRIPYQEFKTLIRTLKLDTATIRKAKEVRKRGKNKVAAKNCRQRKIDSVYSLNGEITHLRQQLKSIAYQKDSLIREVQVWKARCSALESQSKTVQTPPMKPPLYCSPM